MSTSVCPSVEHLRAFQAGRLAEAEAAAVAEHLNACNQCRQALARMEDAGAQRLSKILKPAQTPDEIGRIAFFRVLREIGAGGMGLVLEAEDVRLQRRVALKIMKPELAEDQVARTRFLREARAMASIHNDHIVTIYHVGIEASVPVLAMELLAGQTLRELLKTRRELPLTESLRIIRESALGLKAAHDGGLVHRDIKPENIWLRPDGQVKILDFGLARVDTPLDNLTREGQAVGTPGYVSPEQARGQRVDRRSDVFSLGCVFYELLTGKSPFQRETMMATLTALAMEDPLPIRRLNPSVPASVEQLVLRMLAKKPEERLDSADMLLQQLDLIRGSRENGLSVRDLPTAASPEPVEFTEGGVSDYRTEMRDLLRQRLRALSLIAVLVSLWMMVVNDFWRMAPGLLSFRLALLGVAIGAYAVLASKLPLSTRRLHRLGLVLLASICVVLVVVPSENMLTAAEKGQDSLAAAQRVMFMATWSILILGHALFIPSTWKRAALTLFLLAIFAKINIVVLAHMSADLRRAWDIPIFQIIVEMPIIAAAIGTYAVYLLNQLRYQAFQAQLLGQYVLKEKIGAGPVGEVFRGEHYYLKRPCAIKLIRPGPDIDADTLARFEKAIQFTNTITDPGVVLVYDYGRSRDGALYCVMELLPGMSAAQIVEEFGPLPPARVAHVLQQASSALGEAHAIGFFHRNLKPGNLMLSQAGRTHDSVKLLDFGLNREISGKHVPPDAALYASPEQATDEPFNASSDVYELGAVAYYLLTGKPVFMTSNPL